MHRAFLLSLIIVLILVSIVCCTRCACGCYRWCSCVTDPAHKCCCGTKCTDNKPSTEQFLVNNHRRVTYYYTDWCSYCKTMRPVWDRVKAALAGSSVQFYESNEDINKTPNINSYPTILMITESGRAVKYKGAPDFITLRNWIVSPNPYEY